MRKLVAIFLALIVFSMPIASLQYFGVTTSAINFTVSACHVGSDNANGDTGSFTAWSKTTDGGPFNGGYIFGTYGDGCWGGSSDGYHTMTLKMDAFNPTSIGGVTISFPAGGSTNTMSGWGVGGQAGCMGEPNNRETATAGLNAWIINDTLYMGMGCQTTNFSYSRETIMRSPREASGVPFMRTWCRPGRGSGNDHTGCDAVGDMPTDGSTGVMWSQGEFGSAEIMGRLVCMPWGQDAAGGPAVPAGVDGAIDTTYTYCWTLNRHATSVTAEIYSHRFLTSADPQLNASWKHWVSGTYQADAQMTSSTPLTTNFGTVDAFAMTVFYMPNLKKFVFIINSNGTPHMAVANFPWGPLVEVQNAGWPTNSLGFPGFMPHTYTETGTGRSTISYNYNGAGFGGVISFNTMTFTGALFPMPSSMGK